MTPELLFQDSPWLAVPMALVAAALSAALSGPGPLRAALALAAALPAVFLPWLVPSHHGIYRFFLCLLALLPVIRAFDRAREKQPLSFAHRLWAATAPFETRAVSRVPPSLDLSPIALTAFYFVLAALGYGLAFRIAPSFQSPARWLLRWLGGTVFIYCTVDAVIGFFVALYRAIGITFPPVHKTPILAKSLQEFWGERWNLTMRGWFYRHCFMPMARRRMKTLGVAAAFGASTLLHIWLAFVVAGLWPALWMGAFFVVQGVLTLLERRIGVLSWNALPARLWTVICLLCTAPLFVEPMLLGFGP